MKQPFSLIRLVCRMTGHRLTRRRDVDGYGRPLRVCRCGLLHPRPDSDPWPDLDGADTGSRPDSEGPWRDDKGYWLGGMGTPDTGSRPDSGHPHDGYAYDGCVCVCCVNVRALSTPRTETSE